MKTIIATIQSLLSHGLLVICAIAASPCTPVWGEAGVPRDESREKAAILAVKADPVFGGQQQDYEWRYTSNPAQDTTSGDSGDSSWLAGIEDSVEFLSRVLRILVWVGIAMLLSALIYLSWRYRDRWLGPLGRRAAPPDLLFGLDVRPDSLPDDVAASALQHLAQGNPAAALGLLYRATLVSLIHRSQLDFHAGDTEDDCLRRVAAVVDAGRSGYFAELLDAWKRTAYAHEAPPPAVLTSLCGRWGDHFSRPSPR